MKLFSKQLKNTSILDSPHLAPIRQHLYPTVGSTAPSCCSSSSPVHSFSHQAPFFFGPPAYKIPQVWVSDPSEPQDPQCTSWALSSFPKVFICLEHHGERERKAGILRGWSLTWLRTGVPHLGALKLPILCSTLRGWDVVFQVWPERF